MFYIKIENSDFTPEIILINDYARMLVLLYRSLKFSKWYYLPPNASYKKKLILFVIFPIGIS